MSYHIAGLDNYLERGFTSQYERNEDITIKECPDCQGHGKTYLSDCCGAEVVDGICQDIECLKSCITEVEKCDVCRGEGEIEC